jgi:hypothetical protein
MRLPRHPRRGARQPPSPRPDSSACPDRSGHSRSGDGGCEHPTGHGKLCRRLGPDRAEFAIRNPHAPPLPTAASDVRSAGRPRGCCALNTAPESCQLTADHRRRRDGRDAIDDRRHIAVRNHIPQQILRAAQLVVGLLQHGELHLEPLRREGRHHRRARRGWRSVARRCRRAVLIGRGVP